MKIWKILKTVYLVFVLLVILAATFVGVPLYRYLKTPIEAPSVLPASPAAPAGEKPAQRIDPASLLQVSPERIPKFEGMVERIAPGSPQAWTGLGILYQFKDRPQDAARCYERAIRTDPKFADAHYRLGTVHHTQNRLGQAEAAYRDAMHARPEFIYPYFGLAAVYQSLGKHPQAELLYKQILQLKPNDYQAHNNLAIVYEEQGMFDDALKEYETAASLNSRDPVVQDNLTRARAELGTDLRAARSSAPAPAAGPAAPVRVPEPAAPSRPAYQPAKASTLFLKNKQVMTGQVVQKDARGLWFEIDHGTKLYVSHEEIVRIE